MLYGDFLLSKQDIKILCIIHKKDIFSSYYWTNGEISGLIKFQIPSEDLFYQQSGRAVVSLL